MRKPRTHIATPERNDIICIQALPQVHQQHLRLKPPKRHRKDTVRKRLDYPQPQFETNHGNPSTSVFVQTQFANTV
jgi:hypothetical protein